MNGSPAEALAQTTVTLDTPEQARRHLRPDRDRRPGHDGPARAPGRGARPADARERRRTTVAELTRILELDEVAAAALRDRMTGTAQLRHPAPRPRADDGRPDPRGDRRQARLRAVARTGTRAGLSAVRRRTGIDPRGPPPRLRQPRRRRPVRRRAAVPGDAGRRATGRRRRSATPAARRCSTRRSSARPGVPGTDLRLTIDAGLQLRVEQELLAAWVADRAQARLGGGHGPVHRRDLRDGDLSVV